MPAPDTISPAFDLISRGYSTADNRGIERRYALLNQLDQRGWSQREHGIYTAIEWARVNPVDWNKLLRPFVFSRRTDGAMK